MARDLRGKVFTALTGIAADVSGRPEGDIRGMLMAIGGPSTRTRSGIDLSNAARKLGVSRRTAERWVKTAQTGVGQRPSPQHAKALARRARQAATTKTGRRAAVIGSGKARAAAARGARVSVNAMQGPHTRDYMRRRVTQLDLDPADAQAMVDAWVNGGDKGFMDWANNYWGQEYVDDWRFGDVDEITVESPHGGTWR